MVEYAQRVAAKRIGEKNAEEKAAERKKFVDGRKNLTMKEFKGNWATMLLPIHEDESIDYGLLEKEIDRIIDAKVDGIYSMEQPVNFLL